MRNYREVGEEEEKHVLGWSRTPMPTDWREVTVRVKVTTDGAYDFKEPGLRKQGELGLW